MVYVRLDGDVSSEDSCLGSADVKRQVIGWNRKGGGIWSGWGS